MQRSAILRCIFLSAQLGAANNVGYAIKTAGFRKKSGGFLTFRGKMDTRKTGVELDLELTAKSAKIEYRENPTFSQ